MNSTPHTEYPVIYDDRVVINVSGMIFETRQRTLERFPQTLLGNEEKRSKFYVPELREYFFNRKPLSFRGNSVLLPIQRPSQATS